MTLRGRLTAAFLAVAFGPVLLGAVFVASTVAAVDRSRATERLAVAATAVRTSVDALCQQLRAAADAVAVTADHSTGPRRFRWPTPPNPATVGTRCSPPRPRCATSTSPAPPTAGPTVGQPLPLVLSVPSDQPPGLHAVLVAVVLMAALLGVAAAWRLARVTTRPLVELAGAADRVATGDLTARVPVHSRDEIGQLAVAFNRMTRETGGYLAALTSSRDQLRGHLAVLGDTLASTHDLPRILRVILHSALAATGARAGAVLLTEQGEQLVARCCEGLDERGPGTAPLRVPLGSGAVAATGQPRRGRAEAASIDPDEPRCRTYIAVPFAAPDPTGGDASAAAVPGRPAEVVLGVLALYDRLGGDEFDDDDLATLRTFARHAAVAVDNVRVHEEAQRLSLTDPLTGLWNYRYLRESLRREVERASRFGRMVSVLALDLDRFKRVNDTYGHAAGDTVLAEFARRVRGEIREVDLAFRRGGEEFVVLLPETDARGATIVAERLGAAVRDAPVTVVGHAGVRELIPVTVSVGIAVFPDHADTGPQVLAAADEALYAAKTASRDTWRLAPAREPSPTREVPVSVRRVLTCRHQRRSRPGPVGDDPSGGPRPVLAGRPPTVRRPDRGTTGNRQNRSGGRRVFRSSPAESGPWPIVSRHVGALSEPLSDRRHRPSPCRQGRHPGRRTGHPVPAGHQGRSQGTVAGGRPTGIAVHRRGSRPRRHRRRAADHRPGQDVDGGPFRPSS